MLNEDRGSRFCRLQGELVSSWSGCERLSWLHRQPLRTSPPSSTSRRGRGPVRRCVPKIFSCGARHYKTKSSCFLCAGPLDCKSEAEVLNILRSSPSQPSRSLAGPKMQPLQDGSPNTAKLGLCMFNSADYIFMCPSTRGLTGPTRCYLSGGCMQELATELSRSASKQEKYVSSPCQGT